MEKSINYYCNIVSNTKTIVERLYEELEKRGVSVLKFANETGINKDRVYKWKKENTNPKSKDEEKILAWLNMEKVPHETKEDKRISTLEARCDVLTGVVVELLFATSGESRAIIQKKLDSEVLKILEIGR